MQIRGMVQQDIPICAFTDDRPSNSVERIVDLHQLREMIEETILPAFSPNYRRVIPLLFGFHGNQTLSIAEAAQALRISTSRIHCMKCLFVTRTAARWGEVLRCYLDDVKKDEYALD